MADYQVVSESPVYDIVREYGRKLCFQEARLNQKLFAFSFPEDEYLAKSDKADQEKPIPVVKRPGSVWTFSVKYGGIGGLGTATAGGARPSPSNTKYQKARAQPKILAATIEFPSDIFNVAIGDEGIEDVSEKLSTLGGQAGAYLARSWGGAQVASMVTGGAIAATTFTVNDSSGYFVGQTYDRYTSGGTYVDSFRVSDVSISMTNSFTITVAVAFGTALATTDLIYLKGEGAAATRFVSMTDVCSASTNLYGIVDGSFPSGLSFDMNGAGWDNVLGRKLCDVVAAASNGRPTHAVSSSQGVSKIVNAQTSYRRFNEGVMDIYGLKAMFNEMPLIEDDNQPSTKIRFINKNTQELRESWEFAPVVNGDGAGSWSRASVIVDHEHVSRLMFFEGGYEFINTMRRANAEMINVGDS